MSQCPARTPAIVLASFVAGIAFAHLVCHCSSSPKPAEEEEFTIANQPQRFANAKEANNGRVMNIEEVYEPGYCKGKTVLVTGGNRGLGFAIASEFLKQGARVIVTVRSPVKLEGMEVISGVDVTDDKVAEVLTKGLAGAQVDILVNNAGYFMEAVENMAHIDFKEDLSMIDICAVGPLRVTQALFNAQLLPRGARVAMITSQGGSISWRTVQNPQGGDYGHHMSKAAANMMGALVSQEFKQHGIAVANLHPGFNKTDMTAKYKHIWAVEGAVDSAVGAKRVVHEIGKISMETTGRFINCEDGLRIPW